MPYRFWSSCCWPYLLRPSPLMITLLWEGLRDGLPGQLLDRICEQLRLLHHLPAAQQFVREMCGGGGPFGSKEILTSEFGSRIALSLVEVGPRPVAKCLLRAFGNSSREELLAVTHGRRNLVWTLERPAWWEDTFTDAAELLLAFAEAENESWGNNATNQFLQLYRVFLSGTRAPYSQRWQVIDRALACNSLRKRQLAVQALGEAVEVEHLMRMGGPESQGSRTAEQHWPPQSAAEWNEIMITALERLQMVATDDTDVALLAAEQIVQSLWGLFRRGMSVLALKTAKRIASSHPSLQIPLYAELHRTKAWYGDRADIDEAMHAVMPSTMEDRLAWVQNPPFVDERQDGKYVDVTVRETVKLAEEMAGKPDELERALPSLLKGTVRNGFEFGKQIGALHEDPKALVKAAISLLKEYATEGNPSVLLGLLHSVSEHASDYVVNVIMQMSADPVLSRWTVDAVRLVMPTRNVLEHLIASVRLGKLPVASLRRFLYGAVLQDWPFEDMLTLPKTLEPWTGEEALVFLEILFQYADVNGLSDNPRVLTLVCQLATVGGLTKAKGDTLSARSWQESIQALLAGGYPIVPHFSGNLLNAYWTATVNHVGNDGAKLSLNSSYNSFKLILSSHGMSLEQLL